MSGTDELERRAETLERQTREKLLRAAVVEESFSRGIFDHEAAYRLLDRELLVYGADGAPLNVLEAIDALVERRPWVAGEKPVQPRRRHQDTRGLSQMEDRLRRAGAV